ncbi:hypothetical protein FI667_g1249, partial [Globisporangium splendens]
MLASFTPKSSRVSSHASSMMMMMVMMMTMVVAIAFSLWSAFEAEPIEARQVAVAARARDRDVAAADAAEDNQQSERQCGDADEQELVLVVGSQCGEREGVRRVSSSRGVGGRSNSSDRGLRFAHMLLRLHREESVVAWEPHARLIV